MNSEIGLFEHFRLLFSFGGRESRGSFWPFAAVVLGILMAANILMMIPFMMAIGDSFDGGSAPHLPNLAYYFVAMFGLGILLYAAAMARRLRDSGRSPLWALMPLPFITFSTVGMSMLIQSPLDGTPPDMSLFKWLFISNALYMLSLIALVVLLALPSKPLRGGRPD